MTGNKGKSINPWGINKTKTTLIEEKEEAIKRERVAGGSSGGSAVAVAADLALGYFIKIVKS